MLDSQRGRDRCWITRGRDRCFTLAGPTLRLRRTMAIGDAVAATAVADRLAELGARVLMQTDPMIGPVVARCPSVAGTAPPTGPCDINLDGAYENHPERRLRHFHDLFFIKADEQLERWSLSLGPATNTAPTLYVGGEELQRQRLELQRFERPWTLVCPRSNFYQPRTVPDGIWQQACKGLPGTQFWIGLHQAPQGFVDLHCRDIGRLPVVVAAADFMLTVDTGPMHLAAALGVPLVAVSQSSAPELHLTDQQDYETVAPPNLGCLNCQKNVCPLARYTPPCQSVPPELIRDAALRRMRALLYDSVSCVIPTYNAPVERLNRCLSHVIPQVQEVIVTRAADGKFPAGAMQHAQVRYVTCPQSRIGFGRNVNFGVRHSANRLVLILNDDVYLAPDAVEKMRECLLPDVGCVGHLLRYPDGTIYHGGVSRNPGTLDWGHIDHRRYEPTIQQPRELEQVTGASFLWQRRAFYEARGYDENFYLYCEDNDLCMKARALGWKVFYTPHAMGIHEGSATSRLLPNMMDLMHQSQRYFHEKWDWYLRKNISNTLGSFR